MFNNIGKVPNLEAGDVNTLGRDPDEMLTFMCLPTLNSNVINVPVRADGYLMTIGGAQIYFDGWNNQVYVRTRWGTSGLPDWRYLINSANINDLSPLKKHTWFPVPNKMSIKIVTTWPHKSPMFVIFMGNNNPGWGVISLTNKSANFYYSTNYMDTESEPKTSGFTCILEKEDSSTYLLTLPDWCGWGCLEIFSSFNFELEDI